MLNHTPELTPELLAQIREYADNDLPIGSTTAKEWLRAQQAEIERLSKENKIYRRKNSIWGFDVADRNVREAEAALQQSREENERLRNKLQYIDGQRMDAESENERLRGELKVWNDAALIECDVCGGGGFRPGAFGTGYDATCDCSGGYIGRMTPQEMRERLEQIKAERDDYRKALEWYASKGIIFRPGEDWDVGHRARSVLSRYKRGDSQ